MPSFNHQRLLDRISMIDTVPESAARFAKWLHAHEHLQLLCENAIEDDMIIYASAPFTFIHAVVVHEEHTKDFEADDLLDWSGNPFSLCAGYRLDGTSNDVRIDRSSRIHSVGPITDSQQLVFARSFEGLKTNDSTSYEILQEYIHVTEIFWRPEYNSYCRFDEHGDFDHIVSITPKPTVEEATLVSFKREQLEQYLAASNSLLLRMFDFTLHRKGQFSGWPSGPEQIFSESGDLSFRQKVDPGKAAYTRGVQIVRPSRSKSDVFKSIRNRWNPVNENPGVEFIAFDWRNRRVASISTHPSATTNYFEDSNNSLPYEVSPAFFRPEVLHKYKADHDKYTVSEDYRFISCRGAWHLQTYDINEDGQVHTYICYLRNLPYEEQLYWRSFNEKPRSGISERAFQSDFEGEWSEIITPLEKLLHIARRWSDSDMSWWTLREESLLERVNTPRTASREEWARAFSGVATLIIEGFQVRVIRERLRESGITFELDEKSLKLIERFLVGHGALARGEALVNLRTVQHVRSKVSAHYGGSAAEQLANNALREHGNYSAHFESVCERLVQELTMIEKAFS